MYKPKRFAMNKILLALAIVTAAMVASCVKPYVAPDNKIKLKSAKFASDSLILTAGTVYQVDIKCDPDNFDINTLKWQSSDTTVVAVSSSGSVDAKKEGQATITVISPDNLISVSCKVFVVPPAPACNPTQLTGAATDIGIGADGSVFITGTDSVSATGGFSIRKWNGSSFVVLPACAAVRVAAGPDGTPWVVNKSHLIFNNPGLNLIWNQLPGTATDIAVGADGSAYIIGTDSVSATGGYSIQKWNGNGWTVMPQCAGVRIAVDPHGTPWVVNKSHLIFRYPGNGVLWEQMPGAATDIGIGADGSVYITGTDVASNTGGYSISKWNGYGWTKLSGVSGVNISVSPQGNPWWVDQSHLIFKN